MYTVSPHVVHMSAMLLCLPLTSMAFLLQQVLICDNSELPAELSSRLHPAQLRP